MTFYWKKDSTIYHWHLQCATVPIYVRTDADWEISEQRPTDKERCRECREKDLMQKIKTKV